MRLAAGVVPGVIHISDQDTGSVAEHWRICSPAVGVGQRRTQHSERTWSSRSFSRSERFAISGRLTSNSVGGFTVQRMNSQTGNQLSNHGNWAKQGTAEQRDERDGRQMQMRSEEL